MNEMILPNWRYKSWNTQEPLFTIQTKDGDVFEYDGSFDLNYGALCTYEEDFWIDMATECCEDFEAAGHKLVGEDDEAHYVLTSIPDDQWPCRWKPGVEMPLEIWCRILWARLGGLKTYHYAFVERINKKYGESIDIAKARLDA